MELLRSEVCASEATARCFAVLLLAARRVSEGSELVEDGSVRTTFISCESRQMGRHSHIDGSKTITASAQQRKVHV